MTIIGETHADAGSSPPRNAMLENVTKWLIGAMKPGSKR